jgi:hypothetical protein
MIRTARVAIAVLIAAGVPMRTRAALDTPRNDAVVLDVHAFRPVEGPSSGPAMYYRVVEREEGAVLRRAGPTTAWRSRS